MARLSTSMMRGRTPAGHRSGVGAALLLLVLLLLALVPLAGCSELPSEVVADPPRYLVEVQGERFRVQVTDPLIIAELEARLKADQEGVVMGRLLAGHGGFNQPWSWHLDPTTVDVVDMAIELCDGRPSMVEADLSYWIGTVGSYCPWGAKVLKRER